MNQHHNWILIDGMMIYPPQKERTPNKQLIGGFMQAIIDMTKEMSKEGIQDLKTSEHQYQIIKDKQVTFIGRFPKNMNREKALSQLEDLQTRFRKHFSYTETQNWTGNIKKFERILPPIVQKTSPTPLQKLKKVFGDK